MQTFNKLINKLIFPLFAVACTTIGMIVFASFNKRNLVESGYSLARYFNDFIKGSAWHETEGYLVILWLATLIYLIARLAEIIVQQLIKLIIQRKRKEMIQNENKLIRSVSCGKERKLLDNSRMMEILGQLEMYEDMYINKGDDSAGLGMINKQNQAKRFKVLCDILNYGKHNYKISILDWGCGFGDLYGYLAENKLLSNTCITDYMGYDIFPHMIKIAKEKYPGAKFKLLNIIAEDRIQKYDYVLSSAVFNVGSKDIEKHMEYIQSMLMRMYETSNYGVAINYLGNWNIRETRNQNLTIKNLKFYYYKIEDIINICRKISSKIIVRNDYDPLEFTLYLLK